MTEGVARKGRARRRALLASGLVALVLSACAKKVTTVDPGFTPEGAASLQNGLAVWREIANPIYVYHRGQPDANPPIPNTLLDSVFVPTPIPGQIHGVIFRKQRLPFPQRWQMQPEQLFQFLSACFERLEALKRRGL